MGTVKSCYKIRQEKNRRKVLLKLSKWEWSKGQKRTGLKNLYKNIL